MVDVKTWMDLVRSLIRLTQIRFVGTLDICFFPIMFVLVFSFVYNCENPVLRRKWHK